jgi:hypothetical protein
VFRVPPSALFHNLHHGRIVTHYTEGSSEGVPAHRLVY